MAEVKVGDLLFARTKGHGEDRDKFFPHQIVGTTGRSWLVSEGPRTYQHRVNMKTMLEANGVQQGMARLWYTKEAMEDQIYWETNAGRIAEKVRYCDVVQLRAIAAIVEGPDRCG